VLSGTSVTLVDSLDTLAVINDPSEFTKAVLLIINSVTFDRDVTVSVFETNIRVLGGLLSGHLLASDPSLLLMVTPYEGQLLDMAVDLADRLLPAFNTPTGIPYHRVNLRRGVEEEESPVTCPAAGGTFTLELGLLSRLTGEAKYEQAARRAVRAIWGRRDTGTGLVGNAINVVSGAWVEQHSSIGAGIDSFYEYLLKVSVLLGEEEDRLMWREAEESIETHLRHDAAYLEVDMTTGKRLTQHNILSSLGAFYPGNLVLEGRVSLARRAFQSYYDVWRKYRALPDLYDLKKQGLHTYGRDYPLRPEMVESAYSLFTATHDVQYLRFGREVVTMLQEVCRVKCGFASIADVTSLRLDDRMDSYFISETLKYIFLLFQEGVSFMKHSQQAMATSMNSLSSYRTPLSNMNSPSDGFEDPAVLARSEGGEGAYREGGEEAYREDGEERTWTSSIRNGTAALPLDGLRFLFSTEGHFFFPVPLQPASRGDGGRGGRPTAGKLGWGEEVCEDYHLSYVAMQYYMQNRELVPWGSLTSTLAPPLLESGSEGIRKGKLEFTCFNQSCHPTSIPGTIAVRIPHLNIGTMAAIDASFGSKIYSSAGLSGPLVIARPLKACSTIANHSSCRGCILIIQRGGCTFVEKVKLATAAGAVGAGRSRYYIFHSIFFGHRTELYHPFLTILVLVYMPPAAVIFNNRGFDSVFKMVGDASEVSRSLIPSVMVSQRDGRIILQSSEVIKEMRWRRPYYLTIRVEGGLGKDLLPAIPHLLTQVAERVHDIVAPFTVTTVEVVP
jgi:hypothetical protein